MSPHTILSNQASTSAISNPNQDGVETDDLAKQSSRVEKYGSSAPEFSSYVEKLLQDRAQNPNQGLLSPTIDEGINLKAVSEEGISMKESIDMAILRSNAPKNSKQSANRFEIKRGGVRVAIVMLAKPAFRLGEVIPVAVAFQESSVPCYSLHSTLETCETIDPTIALRSKASIHRVTRKVHASQHESTISASRVFFSPTIPINAVPDFVTSGVSLEWSLRFEFVTSRIGDVDEADEAGEEILEEVLKDERGTVKAAVQGLLCETFDVTVPLRVYGAIGPFDENSEAGEFRI